MVARILRDHGYEVLVAAEGQAALETYAGAQHVDLLVTDLVMPRMSGLELAQALHARNPAQRVLFMSGYADDLLGLDQETIPSVLAKPFGADQLLRRVRSLLDAPPIG
jgi:CheY-like chemotaxis protein